MKNMLKLMLFFSVTTLYLNAFWGEMLSSEPKVSISDAQIIEGNSGTSQLVFVVTLDSPAPEGGVTVEIEPHNITAIEGEDYTRHTSSISFSEDETTQTVFYLINGDTTVESDETFKVELHDPQHASLDTKFEGVGTIFDDDIVIGECSDVFVGAISSTRNEIKLGTQSKIYNNNAPLVTKNLVVGTQAQCDHGTCTKTDTLAPTYDFDIELGDGTGQEFIVPEHQSITISESKELTSVEIEKQSNLTINGNHTFNIGEGFEVGVQSNIYLNGDMIFKFGTTFSMLTQSDLYIDGNIVINADFIDIGTQAKIHLEEDSTLILIGNSVSLGTQSFSSNEDVPDFVVLSKSDLNIKTQGHINGIFYAQGRAIVGTQAKIKGAITAKEIDFSSGFLGAQAKITYSQGIVNSFCDGDTKYNISGHIFNDTNHNGIREGDEDGLNKDSYIKLCKMDNTLVQSIHADNSTGEYAFDNIPKGEYKLIEDASNTSNCIVSTDAEGFLSTTANTLDINLSQINTTNIIDKDFGNFNGSTISGQVYNDTDGDGHMDGDEVGIADISLVIKKCGNQVMATTVTDANGSYKFWVPVDSYDENWVGIWKTTQDDYNATGDEFDNGNGNQDEASYGPQEDDSWLCFSNRAVNFDIGGLELVGNNFGEAEEHHGVPFSCPSESFLTTGSSSLYSLNLLDGTSYTLKEHYATTHINAIGYNVKDNFIWGWDKGTQKVMRLDANYTVTTYDTSVPIDLITQANTGFTSGDVSVDGILYLAKPSADPRLHKFDLNSGVPVYLGDVNLTTGNSVQFGDFAINPKDGYLYTSYNGRLYRISTDGVVSDLGKINGLVDYYFHSFVFDRDGNMYFYSNANDKKVFKLDLSDFDNPSLDVEPFVTLTWVTASGDGARCANASMPEKLQNIGEYRFDNCDNEWKRDYSNLENNITGGLTVVSIKDDNKTYMSTSLSSYNNNDARILHKSNYEIDEGTISMLIYNHHNISTSHYNLLKKGNLLIKTVRVDDDKKKGSIDITLDGHTIHTNEIYWTTQDQDNDFDTQWVHVAFSFGSKGMKLYINGELKGSNPYTGGLADNSSDFILPNISGYYDELYLFKGQATDTKIEELYTNSINNKNIDGTDREELSCEPSIEPVDCIKSAFIFQGQTDIFTLNLVNGDMPQLQDEPISTENINAIGYNEKDRFFWGYNHDKNDGTIGKIGLLPNGKWSTKEYKVDGLSNFNSYVGDVDKSGHLYLKEHDSSKRVVVIDLDKNSSKYLSKIRDFNLSSSFDIADWAFNPIDNKLYAVNNGDGTKYLYKIDPLTGHELSKLDTNITGYREFGATFFDANGFYYVYDNITGEIFRIDVAHSSIGILFSKSNTSSFNDGAMCTQTEFKFDFGDLPDNYNTKLENNGARHYLPISGEPTLYLGSAIDSEHDGKPSSDANLDNNDDGVKLEGHSLQDKTIDAGTTTTLTISTHGAGFLNAWIDWNGDGDFNDTLEQIASNIDGSSGEISLNVISPSSSTNITTYARFRYSYQQNLTPSGSADDGEVEDYKINIDADFEPFSCSDRLYLSNRTESGVDGEDSGSTWLHGFYTMTPTFVSIGAGFESDNGGYNAMGYNVQDNFIYALYGNQLLQIDKDAKIKNWGEVEGLPNSQFYAGEFDRDGYYYVSGQGSADDKMYKIDISQNKVIETITLSESVRFWDMAIDTTGNYFYTMLIQDGDSDSDFNNDKFAKIEIATGIITTIGETHSYENSYISLIFADDSDKIVAISNDNGMYEIDSSNGHMYWLRPTTKLSYYNDGTSCPNAHITFPPRMPRLSIGDVAKAEGDEGETTFEFEVSIDADLPMIPVGMPAMFLYRVIDGDGNDITPPHGIATQDDHDFRGGSGIGVDMKVFSDNRHQTISVPVYGDRKVEKDEEFYVEIYFPDMFPMNFCMMGKDRGVGLILNDDIKLTVTRSNGDLNDTSLYTQIVGRDFDYSMISEGSNKIEDMTLQVELIDNNSTNHTVLYKDYKYMDDSDRIDILDSSDLDILKATRDAVFKVSFLKDENGTISHGNYANENAYNERKSRAGYRQVVIPDVSDHFAIRPASYKIVLGDIDENNQTLRYAINKNQTSSPRLVAEYPYILEINATDYNNSLTVSNYDVIDSNELNITLDFNENSIANPSLCLDTSTKKLSGYHFTNGFLSEYISHNNVGEYTLHIEDIDWTAIDQNGDDSLSGCIKNQSFISTNGNIKSGCDIASNSAGNQDLNITFMPYRFDITSILSNQNGTTKEYLYMSDLNKSTDMGVKVENSIVVKGMEQTRLTNFTKGCMAKGTLSLDLNYTVLLDSGFYHKGEAFHISSINNKFIFPQQLVALHNNIFDGDKTTLLKKIEVNASEFINSELNMSILYNMEKTFDDPSNPIKVDFISFDLNTTDINSTLKGEEHNPVGVSSIDENRTFYFARVASRLQNYPETEKKSIHTPLFVEIFCKIPNNRVWCEESMNMKEVGLFSEKSSRGWYIAVEHNSSMDGRVIRLNSDKNDTIDAIYPTPMPNFKRGRINNVYTNYVSSGIPSAETIAEIAIETDVWLRFNNRAVAGYPLGTPSYRVKIKSLSSTTGAGNTGNIMQSVQKVEHNGKMSW